MNIRRLLAVIMAVILLLSACESSASAQAELKDGSYLSGWYVDGDTVYMVCHLIIASDSENTITVTAYSDEDVGGLLRESRLVGYNEDMSETRFDLERGSNEIIVVFVGALGKHEEKVDYAIPDKIVIESVA